MIISMSRTYGIDRANVLADILIREKTLTEDDDEWLIVTRSIKRRVCNCSSYCSPIHEAKRLSTWSTYQL